MSALFGKCTVLLSIAESLGAVYDVPAVFNGRRPGSNVIIDGDIILNPFHTDSKRDDSIALSIKMS